MLDIEINEIIGNNFELWNCNLQTAINSKYSMKF